MKHKTIYFATGNKDKLREAKLILNKVDVIGKKLNLLELQGEPEEVAEQKARMAFEIIKKPVIAEDTALCFTALKGLPGVYIRHFLDRIGQEGLVKMLEPYKDKSAEAVCCIGYCDGKITKVFKGVVKGKIVEPRAKANFLFGWDPIFEPNGYNKTFSELGGEKHKISHRKKALEELKKFLNK